MSFSKFWQSLMKWLLALLMILLDSSHGKQPKNIFYRGSNIKPIISNSQMPLRNILLGICFHQRARGDVSWWHLTAQRDVKSTLKRYLRALNFKATWAHWKMRGRRRIGIFGWKRFYDNCDFWSVKIIFWNHTVCIYSLTSSFTVISGVKIRLKYVI